jgi:C1A family cysteine protease
MLDFLKGLSKTNPKRIKLGGWKPDPANKKYYRFDKTALRLTEGNVQYQSADDVDLRPYTSARHDQRSTGSCVAQSVVKALEIKRIIQHGHVNHVDLSVLDVYYGARERMTPPEVDADDGTYISLACDVVREVGVCRDSMHPWSPANVFEKPTVMASREARLNRIQSHFKIKSYGQDRLNDIIFNLKAANPVVFGTTVGRDWMSYMGGATPLTVETRPLGGHAMTIIGYVGGLFIIENSWGIIWGEDGFGYVDPAVFTHASTRDLWVIVDGSEAWTEQP